MPRREDHPDRDSQRRLERFDAALRRWAERPAPPPPAWPPARSAEPPSRAGARRAAPRWQLAAASLALVALLGLGFLLRPRSAPPTDGPAATAAAAPVAAVASADEVLVLWLDPETPLYLTLPAAAEAAGDERSTR